MAHRSDENCARITHDVFLHQELKFLHAFEHVEIEDGERETAAAILVFEFVDLDGGFIDRACRGDECCLRFGGAFEFGDDLFADFQILWKRVKFEDEEGVLETRPSGRLDFIFKCFS